MSDHIPIEADQTIRECLKSNRSFALIAGAGSGKTTSLVTALDYIRAQYGPTLRQNGQCIACITYTKRAVEVIRSRLGFDQLYHISTLHSFLWGEIGRFQPDIKEALQKYRIPALIAKTKEKDTGKDTKTARKAREQVAHFEEELVGVANVSKFKYDDVAFSDYRNGQLSHDDVIEISGYLLENRPRFRHLLGARYPYIFVDEAQDTYKSIVKGLNLTCATNSLPLVGYFGDPWQQIYEERAGDFKPPTGGLSITKTENFRCAPQVINFLNRFRTDIHQIPAGEIEKLTGTVEIRLVRAENPKGDRKRYSEPQLIRALHAMDEAIKAWGWAERDDVIRLFLVRQMIARRLNFFSLNQLFTGQFASQRAQDDYESGEHYLLKPFIKVICPLIVAYKGGDSRKIIDILRANSPTYSTNGPNATRSLKEMIDKSKEHLQMLSEHWESDTIKNVLIYCQNQNLITITDRLREQLSREPRNDDYDEDVHNEEKGDWLADNFFTMQTNELLSYFDFIQENTPYSTQHGVKGEEYPNVMVVFDDVEAAWHQYSFTKLLTPRTAGEPTDGQRERGRKLAYVCFSRARENLRILLFTPNPEAAQQELIKQKLFTDTQITIA